MSQLLQLLSGLAAVAASGLLAWRVYGAPLPERPAPAVYAPAPVAKPLVKPGELYLTESPANGFIVVVETVPEGAEVFIDDVEKGPSPASTNLDCLAGKTHRLSLRLAGHQAIERTLTCKKDTMLIVRARLEAVRGR